jgi:hypothetical protein
MSYLRESLSARSCFTTTIYPCVIKGALDSGSYRWMIIY